MELKKKIMKYFAQRLLVCILGVADPFLWSLRYTMLKRWNFSVSEISRCKPIYSSFIAAKQKGVLYLFICCRPWKCGFLVSGRHRTSFELKQNNVCILACELCLKERMVCFTRNAPPRPTSGQTCSPKGTWRSGQSGWVSCWRWSTEQVNDPCHFIANNLFQ